METIKLGSKGEDVKKLQSCLNLVADGVFGKLTQEAVKKFQKANGLTADGVCGAKTWEKLLAKSEIKIATRKINDIILHCSATQEGKDYTVDVIRQWHKNQGWSDIGYHYVIYRDGTIALGRDINKVGSHCSGHNTGSIGICYIGGVATDGKTPKDTRTPQQKESLLKLVKELLNTYNLKISNVHCHNSYTSKKACPSFSLSTFKEEFNKYIKK